MFTLTKKTDYAIIALSYIAQKDAGVITTAREIAERYTLPPALLVNVLKSLCHGELVRSTRGTKGGYSLAVPAEGITLADIIDAIEGPVRFVQCSGDHTGPEGNCDLLHSCPVTRPVRKVHDRLVEFLGQITLAQIAFDSEFGDRGVALSREGAKLRTETAS